MSSTYSTNLAIELIGAGEQAGNWGSTTNTNLGTLIEQAIAGYATQAMADANQTLTMTSGATATARNMFIECTGTLTAARTLTVPGTSPNANTKLYFIYNNTSGGFAITVKVSGQTGVAVPAGAKMSLVCNGTDIVQAVDNFISPALTGTPTSPTASPGTNTTQIASTAFVTAAITAGVQQAYPIGSIFLSTVSTNPATLLGFGTWVAYGTGRMLISADATYTAGSTGGSATTTLSTANLPSHTHTFSGTTGATDLSHTHTYGSANNWGSGSANAFDARNNNNSFTTSGASVNMNHTHSFSGTTDGTGSGTAATTISPYIAVYMWNRTA